MVRLPASAKTEVKKGPWTLEEDQILINHVQQYGHPNWRQLPKQAGMPRCGKSCRLRWINYLRPDIKRGNFTRDEEETIIKLHKVLGNRWSAIASKLPGRTDNEIKNVWHTRIKKKLTAKENQLQPMQEISFINIDELSIFDQIFSDKSSEALDPVVPPQEPSDNLSNSLLVSPQRICSFDMPSESVTGGSIAGDNSTSQTVESPGNFWELDESFWSEVMSENYNNFGDASCDFQVGESWDMQLPFPLSPLSYELETIHEDGAKTGAIVRMRMIMKMSMTFGLICTLGQAPCKNSRPCNLICKK